jgi:hypothetical protein
MASLRPIAQSTCARHIDRAAVGRCADCGSPLCGRCTLEIAKVGTFCWACASARGGLTARRRAAFVGEEVHGVDHPLDPVTRESDLAVLRFEQRCSDREPTPLISGLAERLEQAGADPEDVVDEEELIHDITRLQDHAGEEPPRHAWRLRRR